MNSNAPLIFKKARGAFTLIEILIVMSLIVLLFGITSQLITSVGQSQGRSRARADLELIASGLEAFSGKYGGYPRLSCAANEKFGAGEIYKCLTGKMAMKYEGGQIVMYELSFQSTPFVDSTKLMLGDPSDEYLTDVDPEKSGVYFVDPWRNPYLYFYDTSTTQTTINSSWRSATFILLSKGPDGEEADVLSMYSTGIIPDYLDYTGKQENVDNIIQGRDE